MGRYLKVVLGCLSYSKILRKAAAVDVWCFRRRKNGLTWNRPLTINYKLEVVKYMFYGQFSGHASDTQRNVDV